MDTKTEHTQKSLTTCSSLAGGICAIEDCNSEVTWASQPFSEGGERMFLLLMIVRRILTEKKSRKIQTVWTLVTGPVAGF